MFTSQFPQQRMRRLRAHSFTRKMCQETELRAKHLVYPAFIMNKQTGEEQIKNFPGVKRLSFEALLKIAELCLEKQVAGLALFPVIENYKDEQGREAYNPDGLVPKYLYELKKRFPELGIITDIALDPYTSHGQDGILSKTGEIDNDKTIEILCKQALCHAQAGADIIAPSDMMDGRIASIRKHLEKNSFTNTAILSYSAKYASNFYGPFREAVGSSKQLGKKHKRTYQMNLANSSEALREVFLDIQEGADIVMIKPGLPHLDIIRLVKNKFKVPTFAYQVSGEYTMLKALSSTGACCEAQTALEALFSMRRAGADAIFTYYALQAADWLCEYPYYPEY